MLKKLKKKHLQKHEELEFLSILDKINSSNNFRIFYLIYSYCYLF